MLTYFHFQISINYIYWDQKNSYSTFYFSEPRQYFLIQNYKFKGFEGCHQSYGHKQKHFVNDLFQEKAI